MKKVSIITVCWNAEATINKTIQSVLNQTYKNIDYVVIDGGSSDSTNDILRKYKDYFGFYISEKDNGIYDAMNKALDHVTGDIVFFLNSGDQFYDNRVLEEVVKKFESNDSLSILVGKVQVTKNGDNLFIKSHQGLGIDYIMTDTVCHQGMFFKKEDLTKHRFNLAYKVCADLDMFLQLFTRDKVKVEFIDRIFAYYPLGGFSSPGDSLRIKKIEAEIRKIRIFYYGKLNFLKYEYKKFGFKGLLREILGPQYPFFAELAKLTYRSVTRLIIFLLAKLYSISLIFLKKRKNSILLIGEFDKFGGTRVFLFQLISFYKENNFDLIFASESEYYDSEFIEFLEKNDVKYEILASRKSRFVKLSKLSILKESLYEISEIYKLIKKYKTNALVISIGTPGLYSACITLPTKIIYYMHTYPGDNVHPLNVKIIQNNLSRNKIIVSVSKTSLQIIKDKFRIEDDRQLKLVYNSAGSRNDPFTPSASADNKIVLTVGHVNDYKNPSLWIKVAREVRKTHAEVEFLWIGDGQLRAECEKILKDDKNIVFKGSMSHDDVQKYIQNSDIYFQPSKMESFGLSVVESMKYGKPVVVSDVGGLKEIVDDSTGFKVDPEDMNAFVEKINYLLDNTILASELGYNGRLKFEKKFSKEVWEEVLLDLHKDLFNN